MDILLNIISTVFWLVVILVPIVIIHELGHFTMAKLTGTKVPEFGVGIPPRIFGKHWKGVLWSLNSIPLGGFVRIFGDGDVADNTVGKLKDYQQEVDKPDISNLTPSKVKEIQKTIREANELKIAELKTTYIEERLSELAQNQELDYFLEQNGLQLTEDWRTQIRQNKLDEEKLNQTKTLIGWEFEGLDKIKNAFYNKPYLAKVLIMLGGVSFNFLFAWIALIFLLTGFQISPLSIIDVPINIAGTEIRMMSDSSRQKLVYSYPSTDMVIQNVTKDSLADSLGLKQGDKIISLNDQTFKTTQEFIDTLKRLGDTEVKLEVQNFVSGEVQTKTFNLPNKENDKPQLGVEPVHIYSFKAKNLGDAIAISTDIVWSVSLSLLGLLGAVVVAAWRFISKSSETTEALKLVGGPVSIGAQGGTIFRQGFETFLGVLILLSINLGVFNLLPIPALDGGRVLLLTIQKITGKRNRRVEYALVSATFILLIILSIGVAIKDINTQFTKIN